VDRKGEQVRIIREGVGVGEGADVAAEWSRKRERSTWYESRGGVIGRGQWVGGEVGGRVAAGMNLGGA